MRVSIDELEFAVQAALTECADKVEVALEKAVDKTAKQADEEIRKHITFHSRTGAYVKAFSMKRQKGNKTYKKTWYVKDPQHRLTHLLENGHLNKDGSRTRAYPHIRYGEKIAQQNLVPNFKKEMSR